MKLMYMLTFCYTFFLVACGTTEKSTTEQTVTTPQESSKTTTIDNAAMEANGFLRGVVKTGKEEGACDYVVEILGGIVAQKVDPIDMPASLKSNDQMVWIKFGPSRRANRCPEAKPVIIKEIHQRTKE